MNRNKIGKKIIKLKNNQVEPKKKKVKNRRC